MLFFFPFKTLVVVFLLLVGANPRRLNPNMLPRARERERERERDQLELSLDGFLYVQILPQDGLLWVAPEINHHPSTHPTAAK
jgi:hypothetical protein